MLDEVNSSQKVKGPLELLALPFLCWQICTREARAWVRAPSHSHDERVSDGHWTSHKELTHPEAKRTDRQTQNLPSCLSWSFQLDHTFASQGKGRELEPRWDQRSQTLLGVALCILGPGCLHLRR